MEIWHPVAAASKRVCIRHARARFRHVYNKSTYFEMQLADKDFVPDAAMGPAMWALLISIIRWDGKWYSSQQTLAARIVGLNVGV